MEISNLSKERLLDELKKYTQIDNLKNYQKIKLVLELIQIIFPELKNIIFFTN